MNWFRVRVPASSANLGAGFDALGMALGVYLTCRFRSSASLSIRAEGRDAASIPTTADNLIWQTAVSVAESLGAVLPPIELEILNDIPLGKGMGSSAAAPFIVGADGPDRGLFTALDNLIAEHRVPVMIAISIGNGSGDAQGSERGLEYDTMSGRYAEFVETEVLPIGLGARDTLRLEAGLPLYGQDMDETASPVEANLAFSIGKRRRAEGGFPGAARIQRELAQGPSRIRVGLKLEGRAAARTHMKVADAAGNAVGEVTSGAFTPTAAASIAMAYVPPRLAEPGTPLSVEIRGALQPARVVPMPFVPHNYARRA